MENFDMNDMKGLNERVLERVLDNAKLYNVPLVKTEEDLLELLKRIYNLALNANTLEPIKNFEHYLLHVRKFEPFDTVLPFTCHFSHPELKQKYRQQTIPGDGNCLFNSLRLSSNFLSRLILSFPIPDIDTFFKYNSLSWNKQKESANDK